LTLVTSGSDEIIDQITKQLAKLVDVVDITDMTTSDHIERELALFKVHSTSAEVVGALLGGFTARVLDDHEGHYTIELIGGGNDIDRFLERIRVKAEVTSVVRSGAMAVTRGAPQFARG
jgi:acetolactate synthase-1/3 small subunit